MHVDFKVGVHPTEPRSGHGNVAFAQDVRADDPEMAPRHVFEVRHRLFRLFQAGEQPLALDEQGVARVGRMNAACRAEQQLRTEVSLEPRNAPADQGLRYAEFLGCRGKAAAFHDVDEGVQQIPLFHC